MSHDRALCPSVRGISMLELLVGIVIFSFAMLPILSFSVRSTRATHSVGKHMMAGQVAAGLMDQLLAIPYEESLSKTRQLMGRGRIPLMEHPMLQKVLQKLDAAGGARAAIEDDLKKSFRTFTYSVHLEEASGAEQDQMFKISIQVFWQIMEGAGTERSFFLSAVKFRRDV